MSNVVPIHDEDEAPRYARPWEAETARRHIDHRFIAPLRLPVDKITEAINRAREEQVERERARHAFDPRVPK